MEVAKEGGDGTLAPPEKMAAAIIEILEQKGFLSCVNSSYTSYASSRLWSTGSCRATRPHFDLINLTHERKIAL
jgi:hypothetical protein